MSLWPHPSCSPRHLVPLTHSLDSAGSLPRPTPLLTCLPRLAPASPPESQENSPTSLQVCSLETHTDICQAPIDASSTYMSMCLFVSPPRPEGSLFYPCLWTRVQSGRQFTKPRGCRQDSRGDGGWELMRVALGVYGDSEEGKVLTSYCGDGSHRTRCSSSGRSGCNAGTRAEVADVCQVR